MTYYCKHIAKEEQEAFENLAFRNPAGGFHQSFAWAHFKRIDGWNSYKIGVYKNNKLVAGSIVLQFSFQNGTNFLYLPEGPILDYQNEENLFWQWRALQTAIHSIVDISKETITTHLRIEPRIESCPKWFLSGFKKAPINLQPKFTQVIDLKKSQSKLLEEMKQKGRYNIKIAEKNELSVTQFPLNKKSLDSFYALYSQTYQRNKFDGKPKEFFQAFFQSHKNNATVFIARHQKKDLAIGVVVHSGNRATYLYGASSNENRKLMAPYLLHWEIIKDSKNKGFKSYDLWGVNRSIEDKDHPWHGLSRFKKQLGGEQLNFVGSHDYVYQKDLYEAFLKKHETN
jgi:peptidoglycan pentaglycine glycine transferase (the first glycine)